MAYYIAWIVTMVAGVVLNLSVFEKNSGNFKYNLGFIFGLITELLILHATGMIK